VPAGDFRTAFGATRDPHVVEQELLVSATTPWGSVVVPRTTARFSATPTVVGEGMLPGGHTDEVLAEARAGVWHAPEPEGSS
jgi:crotonobetainyl-CoA:carnitine CoA-transferase CaiB-like acyl-CoA transferase